mmetsp:Transcript_21166/g.61786  ORF Transcript_21166/g.61786 Transcript_21166/m.61786 type:complete len:469 (-) Transcript_21166:200-1606(-)
MGGSPMPNAAARCARACTAVSWPERWWWFRWRGVVQRQSSRSNMLCIISTKPCWISRSWVWSLALLPRRVASTKSRSACSVVQSSRSKALRRRITNSPLPMGAAERDGGTWSAGSTIIVSRPGGVEPSLRWTNSSHESTSAPEVPDADTAAGSPPAMISAGLVGQRPRGGTGESRSTRTFGRNPAIVSRAARLVHAAQRFGGTHSGGGKFEVDGGSGLLNRAATVRQKSARARGGSDSTTRPKCITLSKAKKSGPAARSSWARDTAPSSTAGCCMSTKSWGSKKGCWDRQDASSGSARASSVRVDSTRFIVLMDCSSASSPWSTPSCAPPSLGDVAAFTSLPRHKAASPRAAGGSGDSATAGAGVSAVAPEPGALPISAASAGVLATSGACKSCNSSAAPPSMLNDSRARSASSGVRRPWMPSTSQSSCTTSENVAMSALVRMTGHSRRSRSSPWQIPSNPSHVPSCF